MMKEWKLKHTMRRLPTFCSELLQGWIANGFLSFTLLGGNTHNESTVQHELVTEPNYVTLQRATS